MHTPRLKRRRAQLGFAYAYLLAGVALIGLVIAGIAATDKIRASFGQSSETTDAYARHLIKIADRLYQAAFIFWQDRPDTPLSLTTGPNGLYNPSLVLLDRTAIPIGATSDDVETFFVAEASTLKMVASGASHDVIVAVPRLSEAICSRINHILYGEGSGDPFILRKSEGCSLMRLSCQTAESYTYYRVVQNRSGTNASEWMSPDCHP